jgi:hypothetical protein
MNYYEAHRILNEVKDGINHSSELISYALFLTGDIETPDGSSGMGQTIPSQESRTRNPGSVWVVAGNNQRH